MTALKGTPTSNVVIRQVVLARWDEITGLYSVDFNCGHQVECAEMMLSARMICLECFMQQYMDDNQKVPPPEGKPIGSQPGLLNLRPGTVPTLVVNLPFSKRFKIACGILFTGSAVLDDKPL